ncbi:tRNA (adenine-N(1)-)-methyltransferase catalytic subunit trm61 [Nowakowskiella sp. JEL0078]|nr:tRNA (adenine-N(1)-)-methyltransferase catalytic subunit trm61 [Nowakowskiella sp. JEL0078]
MRFLLDQNTDAQNAVKDGLIDEGDEGIVYISPDNMTVVTIKRGDSINLKVGMFNLSDFIGKRWGEKIPNKSRNGYVYFLKPTPELWSLLLPHRTQILYLPDIAFISEFLELSPGTGSGSFSHSIARSIAPDGHLFTYEYHQPRFEQAQKEFKDHNLSDIVTSKCRDVCKEGFDIEEEVDVGIVKSKIEIHYLKFLITVFLDLPAPWLAIPSAKRAFLKDTIGRICCFSPCIEQVHTTVAALKVNGFTDIRMFETLVRPSVVQTTTVPSIPKPRKHRYQKPDSEKNLAEQTSTNDGINATDEINTSVNVEEPETGTVSKEEVTDGPVNTNSRLFEKQVVSRIVSQVRGHTSYLTFATLLPEWDEAEKAAAVKRTCDALLQDATLLKPDEVEEEENEVKEEDEEEEDDEDERGKRKKSGRGGRGGRGRGRGKRGRHN